MRSWLRKLLTLALIAALGLVLAAPRAEARAGKKPSRSTSHTLKGAPHKAASHRKSTKRRSSKRSRTRRARGQRAPQPARIQEIQQALIDRGYLATPATGKWDAASMEAMRRFQHDNGMDETGKFDALSLIRLGLGPPTAGVGAPRDLAAVTGETTNGKH